MNVVIAITITVVYSLVIGWAAYDKGHRDGTIDGINIMAEEIRQRRKAAGYEYDVHEGTD